MREKVSIDCGAADAKGLRVIIATLGDKSHRDRIDTDNNFSRTKFCQKVISRFKLPESAHEWINDEIIRVADEQDESPLDIWKLNVVTAADMREEKTEWLMPGYIPFSEHTDCTGDPATGKSQAIASISARITRGVALPPGNSCEGVFTPRNVIITNFEDHPNKTIWPRLKAAGADLSRVKLISEVEGFDGQKRLVSLPSDIPRIEPVIVADNTAVWSIDPFVACLDKDINVNNDADVRRVLSQLSDMAHRTGCAVVTIRHLNKKSGSDPLYRAGGSIGISGNARSVVLVGKDPEDPDGRVWASVKSNLGKAPPSLRFHVESYGDTSRVVWGDQCDLEAYQLLDQDRKASGSKLENAKQIIADVLGGGPRGESDVLHAIEQAGISSSTYWRARREIGVVSEKVGFDKSRWLLSLPSSNGFHEGCQNEF